MAIRTQQTELFIIDPDDDSVIQIGGVTAVSGIDASISAIDVTELASDHKTFIAGIAEPSAATITVQFDPSDNTQARLHALRAARKTLHWAIGFSDGIVKPTAAVAPAEGFSQTAVARTFVFFKGFVTTFPFSVGTNESVTAQLGVQLTDVPTLVAATAP